MYNSYMYSNVIIICIHYIRFNTIVTLLEITRKDDMNKGKRNLKEKREGRIVNYRFRFILRKATSIRIEKKKNES